MSKDSQPDDMSLFREMVGDVKPVEHGYAEAKAEKPKARPLQKEADEKQVMVDMLSDHVPDIETGEELSYHQNGIQKTVLKKLRRGQFRIEDELDLHGYTADQARQVFSQFLNHAREHSLRCVRIIHGKGLSKGQGPVLKPLVNGWLRQRGDVLAFCSARQNDGGTGAVYVLLKSSSA